MRVALHIIGRRTRFDNHRRSTRNSLAEERLGVSSSAVIAAVAGRIRSPLTGNFQMKRARAVATTAITLTLILAVSANAQAQSGRGKTLPGTNVPPAEQHQRVQQEQQRSTQYRQHLDKQLPAIQQQTAQLQQQQRSAQYRVQQQYTAQLQQQRQHLQVARDYTTDPYVTAPPAYRYRVGNVMRQTNEYGADVLRQAVNYGYQQGFAAGHADRQDRWASNYQNSVAYRDANYGYSGNYVDEGDYNYYFREGFQRGYDDGYGGQLQYGTLSNGSYSILGSVLTGILGLVAIR